MSEQNWQNLLSYWGKAGDETEGHPLVFHQLDVAATGLALLEGLPGLHQRLAAFSGLDVEMFRQWIGFFLAIHDLGKFSSAFQQLRKDLAPGRDEVFFYNIRHDTLGHLAWRDLFADDSQLSNRLAIWSDHEDSIELIDSWVQCVTGHHGQPPSLQSAPISDYFCGPDQDAMRRWVQIAADLFLPEHPQPTNASIDDLEQRKADFSWYLAGLCTLADWLGSNRDQFPYCTEALTAHQYLDQHAWPKARQAVTNSGLLPVATADFGLSCTSSGLARADLA